LRHCAYTQDATASVSLDTALIGRRSIFYCHFSDAVERVSFSSRGVVPLRHLRHVPPPQTVWRLWLILQNRVNSITRA